MATTAFLCYYPAHYQFFRDIHRQLGPAEVDIVVPGAKVAGGEDEETTSRYLSDEHVDHRVLNSGRYRVLLSCTIPRRKERCLFGRWDCRFVRILYATTGKNYTFARGNRVFDLILTIGPYSEEKLSRYARCVSVGLPRYDDLFAGRVGRHEVRADLGIPGSATVVLYAPTWGEMASIDRFGRSVADLTRDCVVIVKPHQLTTLKEGDRLAIFRRPPVRLLAEEYPLGRLFAAADIVISDYSSAIFEAAACDLPVILLDSLPSSARDRPFYDAEELEHTARDIGPRVVDPGDLRRIVEETVRDPGKFRERRAYHARRLFAALDGRSAERSARTIREFVGEAVPLRDSLRRLRRAPRYSVSRLWYRLGPRGEGRTGPTPPATPVNTPVRPHDAGPR